MKCVICDAETNKCLKISFSRSGPDGEPHRGSGKFWVCGEHGALVGSLSVDELELFMMRPNAPPAPIPPVKERDETSAETPFEPQRTQSNGNG
jgi:hypothetical protein